MKLKPSLLLNSLLHVRPLTFIMKYFVLLLLLVSYTAPSMVSTASIMSFCQVCTMYYVTKDTPVHFIDGM